MAFVHLSLQLSPFYWRDGDSILTSDGGQQDNGPAEQHLHRRKQESVDTHRHRDEPAGAALKKAAVLKCAWEGE